MSHFSYGCKLNYLYTCIYYENTKFLRTVSTKSQCTTLQSCYYFLYKNIVHHLAVLLLHSVPSQNAPSCSPVSLSCTKSQCTTLQSCSLFCTKSQCTTLQSCSLSCTKSQCTILQSCYSILYHEHSSPQIETRAMPPPFRAVAVCSFARHQLQPYSSPYLGHPQRENFHIYRC